ncbi:MAG: DUF4252 domain-containing protein [Chryseobacterium sp.]|uniref:DUF4252 domain-containing protein n=1 Tax=Chryseobacterium sp. TaxID=1871047 RepID=UPI001B200513|nr:DUF4252 domain-containing protein [Chryseobacterium sp.]MBO6183835.1 DUF4252 domain-containing protein [Chryseobacterium sp.]
MKIFKNFVLLGCALLLMQSCIVSSKPNIEFFSKSNYDFQDAQFASFNVPLFLAKPYIKKALREEGESEAAIAMVKKVSKIKMMTVANGSEAMLKDYANYLKNENYEDWATIKHDGDNVNIRVKQKGDIIKNMLITVNSKKDMVFLDVRGSFTADDISRMISVASDK